MTRVTDPRQLRDGMVIRYCMDIRPVSVRITRAELREVMPDGSGFIAVHPVGSNETAIRVRTAGR